MRKLVLALFFVLGVSAVTVHAVRGDDAKSEYLVKGEQVEGCECRSVCPCVFRNEATFDDCRLLLVWRVDEGHCGKTDLKGLVFAVAVTKSGKNIEKAMGTWEGHIFVPDKATEEQRSAIVTVLKGEFGPAFAKIDVKTVPIDFKSDGESREATIGSMGRLKVVAIKGKAGKPTVIENAPSPVALPRAVCAKAETNTFDDGTTKWDFAGRNAFFGAMEFTSHKEPREGTK